jgi:DNA-directed RNA polymerase specialized sigma24 family protein
LQVIVARKTPREAARHALDTYGAEVFGFLIGVLGDDALARVVYADVCQRVSSEIESFGRQCSLRTWLYALCRRELRDRRLRGKRAPEHTERDADAPADTNPRRRAGVTGAIAAVRQALSEEERELLILRIDRRLGLDDLALTEIGHDASPFALAGERQALRVRLDDLLERVERLTAQHVRGP